MRRIETAAVENLDDLLEWPVSVLVSHPSALPCPSLHARLTHVNNKLINADDEPSQDWVRQLGGQGSVGVAQCVGELVETTRSHAAAALVAGRGEEAHTRRDDAPVIQGP